MASESTVAAGKVTEPTKEIPDIATERTTTSSSFEKQNGAAPNKRTQQLSTSQSRVSVDGEASETTTRTGIAAFDNQFDEYANGYHFPPKYPMKERIRNGLIWFWDFYNTGFGFFFTIYALNVVGWGFMLLLLLLNASPQMCWHAGTFNCDNIDSPRRLWIEIDSQVLTALFSATGFGLAPWRFRDLYLLLRYRLKKDQKALRRLAAVHRGWLRLEGSDRLPPTLGPKNIEETTLAYDEDTVPYPVEKISDAPPAGVRAGPTALWKMDFIAWMNFWYIIFQGFLSGFMWGLSRYNRPAWTTGVFFALTFATSSAAGIMEAAQTMKVKAVEGVPLTKKDMERLARDKELGIPHHNNIKDKDPKKADKKAKRKYRFSLRSEKAELRSPV